MSEFKAKTDKPLKFDIQEIWDENSCLIEDDVFSLSMVAGKSILGRADFTRAITPLLTAYTTTRAELETVKAELAKSKQTISDLRGGLKEILHNLEDAKQDLKDANKYMLEAEKLNP